MLLQPARPKAKVGSSITLAIRGTENRVIISPHLRKDSRLANTKPRSPASKTRSRPSDAIGQKSRRWPWVLLAIAVVLGGLGWLYRAPILGYTGAGSAYSAHVTCSCRYIGGRSLEDCKKDRLGGMELVSLSDDEEAKSVTARYPLLPSVTATYRKGYGCVLEKWED